MILSAKANVDINFGPAGEISFAARNTLMQAQLSVTCQNQPWQPMVF